MNNTIIFLSLFILFLSLMLIFKIKIEIDINNNKVLVVIYLFKIKIVTISVSIIGLYYQINNSKKMKAINLFLDEEQNYLLMQIKKSIIDKLYYDDIVFISQLGLGDSSDTAINIGMLNFICNIISEHLQTKNRDTILYYSNSADFEKNRLYFYLELKVYFTIFDLIFAIIMSFYKRGKYAKERKQKR